jgi:hypothetical protein
MLRKEGRIIIYTFAFLVALGSFYVIQQRAELQRPLPSGAKVFTKVVYGTCGHQVENEVDLAKVGEMSVASLQKLYPPSQGWKMVRTGERFVFSRVEEGLCEDCSHKTHLGEKGGFVAVIRGPAGVDGEVLRVTKVRVSSLPEELRKQVEKGCLDLPGEEELLQILDSYDENHD